jgi:hypothetical protein
MKFSFTNAIVLATFLITTTTSSPTNLTLVERGGPGKRGLAWPWYNSPLNPARFNDGKGSVKYMQVSILEALQLLLRSVSLDMTGKHTSHLLQTVLEDCPSSECNAASIAILLLSVSWPLVRRSKGGKWRSP